MLLRALILIILLLSLHLSASEIQQFRFAVVPKTVSSEFFLDVKKGCKDAAEEFQNVTCIFKGAQTASPFEQVKIIEELIEQKVDGIAVSVLDSRYLIQNDIFKRAKKANIPLITFDSDLCSNPHKRIEDKRRLAYIGTDNFTYGVKLAEALKKERPFGGTLCIQAGWKNATNIQERLDGFRYALNNYLSHKKLQGENGWKELERCPLYSREDSSLALFQLKWIMQDVDAFVTLGAWSQLHSDYEKTIQPFLRSLRTKEKTFIATDTTKVQLQLLKNKTSFINIGQNPYLMGKESIYTLKNIKEGKPYQENIYTPLTYCTQENYLTCTKSK